MTDLRNWAAAAKTRSDPIFWGICDCSTQTGTLEKGQMPYLLNLTLIYCLQLTTKAATLTADMAIRITTTDNTWFRVRREMTTKSGLTDMAKLDRTIAQRYMLGVDHLRTKLSSANAV